MVLSNIYGNSKPLILNLNNLLYHVLAVKSHFLAEYKGVCVIQCHKMDEISFTQTSELLRGSELCHPRCAFKLYGEVNSVPKNKENKEKQKKKMSD